MYSEGMVDPFADGPSVTDMVCSLDKYIQGCLLKIGVSDGTLSPEELYFLTALPDEYDEVCARNRGYKRFIKLITVESYNSDWSKFYDYDKPPMFLEKLTEDFDEAPMMVRSNLQVIFNAFIANKIPLLYDKESRKYNENCANCVTAYEMRRRGYKVTAGAYINKLKREPEKAWKNPIVIEVNKEPRKEMEDFLKENGSKSRIQIKGTWNNLRRGHTFVAELRKEEIVFLDPQTGVIYNENILDTMNTISYWRIDNLEISDLGVTACEKE